MNIKALSKFLAVIISLPLFFSSCRQEESNFPPASHEEQLDKNLVKNEAAYEIAVAERGSGDKAEFTIEEVTREGHLLKVHVMGGCNEASFKFVWDGAVAESYPMQVRLVLIHNQVGEVCPAVMDHFLVLDLRKLVGEDSKLEDYVFHVLNGSKKQDAILDPNGSSTIKTTED